MKSIKADKTTRVLNVKPKKYFGQHFLKNPQTAKRIVDEMPDAPQYVIEVGPGKGVLSQFLREKFEENLKMVEIDRESIQYLKDNYPDFQNHIIEANFLKLNPGELFKQQFQVAGNFPYNISSQILFRVIELRENIPCMTGMFQKEVAQRIAAPPGSKVYGIISVLTQAFFDARILFSLSQNEFFPPPKVKSSVIQLRRKEIFHLDCDEKLFFKVVKTGFQQRRKTLRNSLKPLLSHPNVLPERFRSERPEQLNVDDFTEITQHIQRYLAE